MPYDVYLKKSAEKELKSLPDKLHDRIVNIILSLKANPLPPNAKKLHGRDGFRVRVGDYRILYIVSREEKKIEVVSIAHRKEVYRV